MNQFYASPDQVSNTHIRLKDQEAKHAAKVLRKGVGEPITITDGKGARYECRIESITKNYVKAEIIDSILFRKPIPHRVLVLGMIKKRDRLEFALEKATELGVSEILLFRGDHSESFKLREDRLNATILSAMKQSLRVFLPPVKIAESIDEILTQYNSPGKEIVYADQEGESTEFKLPETGRILMVVGPEGGLSERERTLLNRVGAAALKLGDYRLRAETAAMVMAAKFGSAGEIRIDNNVSSK